MHTFSLKLVFVLACILLAFTSHGALVDGLHRSNVEINSQQKTARDEAFNAALVKVLIKLSGHENRVSEPDILRQFFPAERYVQSFAYSENPDYLTYVNQKRLFEAYKASLETTTGINDVSTDLDLASSEPEVPSDALLENPPKPFILEVEFSPRAVETQMKQAGLPIWGSVRPEILFWVLLESEGERILIGEGTKNTQADKQTDESPDVSKDNVDFENRFALLTDESDKTPGHRAYDSFLNAAEKFALPLSFPEADELDKSQVQISDLWGLFPDAVDIAKQRYSANGQAMVRLLRSLDGNWTANWYLTVSGTAYTGSARTETLVDITDDIVRQISATLSDRFSVIYTESSLQQAISLEVGGINSFKDYIDVQNFFTSLSPVKSMSLEQLYGEVLTLSIELNSSYEQLKEYLSLSGKLKFIETLSYELPVESNSPVVNQNVIFQRPSLERNYNPPLNQSPQSTNLPEFNSRQLTNVDKYIWMGNSSSAVK